MSSIGFTTLSGGVKEGRYFEKRNGGADGMRHSERVITLEAEGGVCGDSWCHSL